MVDLRNDQYWRGYVPYWNDGSPVPFIETEFQHFQVQTRSGTIPIKSMLSSLELSLLFALAKDHWSGVGEIVDLGCLYGLTTRCFADGLALNRSVSEAEKKQRIYAYDLFLAENYGWWTEPSGTVHAGSWFPEFLTLNRDRLDYVAPCPGDLLRMSWGTKPIEILMIDAAKTWQLNHWVVSKMFPRLIPDKSVVIQQDYVHFGEYWCAIAMEFFADRFEPLEFIYGASGVFLTKKSITEAEAQFDLATLSRSEKERLMSSALEKAPPSAREVLKTAYAMLLIDLGDVRRAREVLLSVDTRRMTDDPARDFSGIARGCFQAVESMIDSETRRSLPAGDPHAMGSSPMIDVKQLLKTYTVAELNETADTYYKSIDFEMLSRKPFIIPGIQHLLVEVSYLVLGLDLRPGDRVLDFGCGIGWTSRILGACGCEVVGTDVSATAIEMARGLAQRWHEAGLLDSGDRPAIEFRQFDGHRIDLPDASVDKIFVLDAFHHVPDQAATLREFSRVLKPGGVVGLCEPGPNHSKHPDSQREMALHKVIENDIVLDDVMALGLEVGFVGMRVCLSLLLPHIVDFDAYKRFPASPAVTEAFLAATDFRVKNYPIFFMQKAGARALDSRSMDGLSAHLELLSPAHVLCRVGETPTVRLAASNNGTAVWLPSSPKQGSVAIGYTINGPNGTSPRRTYLSHLPVTPGERVEVSFALPELDVGHFEVEVDLVSEHVVWFKTLGSNALHLTFDVTAP